MKRIALSVLSAWAMVVQAARPDRTRHVFSPEAVESASEGGLEPLTRESKAETAKLAEKVKTLRTKAAATAVPSVTENEKTKFLAKLDLIVAGMERSLKMTWEDSRKMWTALEKKFSELGEKFDSSRQPWVGTKICDALPFSVEYRRSHAFLAEYDKRIRFRSGKRVGIVSDTGGAGDFAAYALQDGKVYLVDGLDHVWFRSEYRVDAASESVEKKCGEMWVRIPDESLGVVSWSDSSITAKTASGERSADKGVPVGGTMKGKRYLGRVMHRGEFTAGGPEPPIQKDEVAWSSSQITEGVPFAYEWGESKTHKSFARIVFKSGKKVVTRGGMRNKDRDCRVYRLPDERFLLTFQEGTMWEETYGIGLKEETVDLICKGWRIRIPNDALTVGGWEAGSDGVSIDVVTPKGRVKIHGKERVPDIFAGAQCVGTLTNDGLWRSER